MARTEALKRAQKAYIAKFARIEIKIAPKQRDAIQAHAAARGESVNGFIGRAIQETMERNRRESGASQDKGEAGD